MKKTKQTVHFIVELYVLKHYNYTNNGLKLAYDYDTGNYYKEKTTHYFLTPDCYEKTYYKKFNSIHKLNKALELKKRKYYSFNNSLEEAIKGASGFHFSCVNQSSLESILVVRQIHDITGHYTYYNK